MRADKALGIYLDETLSFNKHTSYICAKQPASFLKKLSMPSLLYLKKKILGILHFYLNIMHSYQILLFIKNNRNINHELWYVNDFITLFARPFLIKMPLFSLSKAWVEEIGNLRFQCNKITIQIALKDHLPDQIFA